MTQETPDAGQRMGDAATNWLAALRPEQRAKATFDFDDEQQRTDWAYFPRNHAGLPLHEMDIKQQKLAHVLLTSALSLHAYAKVTAIMALESVLNVIEGRRGDAVRDPGRYFFSVFGTPPDDRWGWRVEGHHVVLNFTVVDGRAVSPTPIFLGANPAQVRRANHPATRPCGEEEDAARELLALFDDQQRAIATICPVAPPDFVLMNLPAVPESILPGEAGALAFIQRDFDAMTQTDREALRFERAQPRGLAGRDMTPAQRSMLSALVDVYVSRLPDDLASLARGSIAVDDVHFAWAGSDKRGDAHYYRLQGSTFLVEYDNTQDGANHVHAVWRDAAADFGADLLRGHVRAAH
jgi:hypothetical protein